MTETKTKNMFTDPEEKKLQAELEADMAKVDSEAEEEAEWEFAEEKMTIRDMIRLKIPLSEIFEAEGIKLPIRWISLIAMVNHKMTKGEKLNLDTEVKQAIKAYTRCMSTSFF